jgi:hypothetical protein
MNNSPFAALLALLLTAGPALAQYSGWKNTGTLVVNTTPSGANLPASSSVEDFPLLVRLHSDFFNFSAAKERGEDIRFSAQGKVLAHELEEWNPVAGVASLWVRIPKITGNARQEIQMHWGKSDALSESKGNAVFNDSNGYLAVIHMGDGVADEVGVFETKDVLTSATPGIIGSARRLQGKQGVFCGEKNEGLPEGASPHSTEAWVRPQKSNGRVVGWGNEHGQGKVVMEVQSPTHIRMDCYFSRGNVSGSLPVPMGEWTHVVHTYEQGESRVYVNGILDAANTKEGPVLAIKRPARLYIGGWYNNYDFIGDIDEVRVSKVSRSAAWVRLQYENQKPLQTLVGPLVQPGGTFAVSPETAVVDEGGDTTFALKAGGAQKIYWILKSDVEEQVVAVDRSAFTFHAGRVSGDQLVTLQCRAVYPDGVRSKDIQIRVRETIADPVFTLSGPKYWDGRKAVEVVTTVVSERTGVKTEWQVGPFAVIKDAGPGKLVLKRAQNSGKLTVTATLNNGGAPVSQSVEIDVTEPDQDAWEERTPAKDEKPEEGQFFARGDREEGTLHYNGTLEAAADSVFLRLYADERLVRTVTAKPDASGGYALSVKLKPGLIRYKVEFGTGKDTVLHTVGDLVCGDAYIINGQSNALATDTREQSPPETNPWIRSYARPSLNPQENAGNLWLMPVWKAQKGERAELGWWGMELAKRLVESRKIPVFLINAAVGGTRIDQHQRNMEDPADLSTIYGRMLWRVRQARLTHGIRAILWHQGENDQGAAGPTGGFGWETYHPFFMEMAAGWKTDFPNVKNYYVFQIWPNACSMGGRSGTGDRLREQQRTLPMLFSRLSILPTLGVRPPGGCHFPLAGWAEFARMVQPLIERDQHGKQVSGPLTAPNLRRAELGPKRDTVVLTFDQDISWDDALAGQFYLDGEKGKVVSGSVSGKVLSLRLAEASHATRVTYLKEVEWSQDKLLMGTNGMAALTFAEVALNLSETQ